MHSSRLRTVRSSGHRGHGVYPSMHLVGVSAQEGEGCLPRGGCQCPGRGWCLPNACCDIHPPVNRMTDRQVWKLYLSATSFADGNNEISCIYTCLFWMDRLRFHQDVNWMHVWRTIGPHHVLWHVIVTCFNCTVFSLRFWCHSPIRASNFRNNLPGQKFTRPDFTGQNN